MDTPSTFIISVVATVLNMIVAATELNDTFTIYDELLKDEEKLSKYE